MAISDGTNSKALRPLADRVLIERLQQVFGKPLNQGDLDFLHALTHPSVIEFTQFYIDYVRSENDRKN